MFTGIIQEVGSLTSKIPEGSGSQLEFSCRSILSGVSLGDSVACNGACLSVTAKSDHGFRAFAVNETLQRTSLGLLKPGSPVNFELALLPSTRLGGHYVSGHIDGTAVVTDIKVFPEGSREMTMKIPEALDRYCIEKGSVALNGVSLTIVRVGKGKLTTALIPITLEHTNLSEAVSGTVLNIEVDIMGKYVEKLLGGYLPDKDRHLRELLANF